MSIPDFDKFPDGLVPAVVQDAATGTVLMLGYMSGEAYEQTLATGNVVFYSRSRQALWMKGETSGHTLALLDMQTDCDNDCLLLQVRPAGPVCHTGAFSCFGVSEDMSFFRVLEKIIAARKAGQASGSYTAKLLEKGIQAIAQKVGEEAVELILEAGSGDPSRFKNEAADLLFHFLVLLQAKGVTLGEVEDVLRERHRERTREVTR